MYDFGILIGIVAFIGAIFILRLVGAWMLRIDEVIKELKEIKKELKAKNNPNSGTAVKYDSLEEAKRAAHNKI